MVKVSSSEKAIFTYCWIGLETRIFLEAGKCRLRNDVD